MTSIRVGLLSLWCGAHLRFLGQDLVEVLVTSDCGDLEILVKSSKSLHEDLEDGLYWTGLYDSSFL